MDRPSSIYLVCLCGHWGSIQSSLRYRAFVNVYGSSFLDKNQDTRSSTILHHYQRPQRSHISYENAPTHHPNCLTMISYEGGLLVVVHQLAYLTESWVPLVKIKVLWGQEDKLSEVKKICFG